STCGTNPLLTRYAPFARKSSSLKNRFVWLLGETKLNDANTIATISTSGRTAARGAITGNFICTARRTPLLAPDHDRELRRMLAQAAMPIGRCGGIAFARVHPAEPSDAPRNGGARTLVAVRA